MSEAFNPIQAMTSLRDWAIKLEEIGQRKISAMVEYNLKANLLLEKEQEARNLLFTGVEEVQASKVRDWIKWYCAKEELEAFKAENKYKEIRDEYEMIDRLISVTQTATKLAETEMRMTNINNLSY